MIITCIYQTLMNWDELRGLHNTILVKPFRRDPKIQDIYMKKRAALNFQQELIKRITHDLSKTNGITLLENTYPYITPPNVLHNVLWFTNNDMTMEQATCWIIEHTALPKSNIVVCCNDLSLKTVPEINHYHVFINHTMNQS